ncbi:MAG TPA: NAD-dependent epimerase/dehydratase family protein [Blastocatellia bacterium]|nr:NAD-dependent epimerase/dehydratase family protein [Blastocatellia bacterium]
MKRVLVTGGAGFIGSHTVDLLLERGYEVRILDSLQPRVHPRGKPDYLPREAEFIQGDVANRDDLGRALRGVSSVIHLAAYQDYLPDFSRFIHTNTESSALLFELIVENNLAVEKIVFASSQSVSGEGRYSCSEHGVVYPEPRSIDQLSRADWEVKCPSCGEEMTPLLIDEKTVHPHTAYAISKYAIELLANSLGRRYKIPTACMRYTYVQGTRNSFYNAYSGIARRFALRLLNGLPPICYEDGKQLRDYVNVKDIARANLLVMEDEGANYRVFNAGGGRAVTVLEFAEIMVKEFAADLEPLVPGEFRLGDTRHTISDNAALNALGWEPAIPVEHNVSQYVAWMREQKNTAEYLEEAERVMRAQGVVQSVRQG